MSVRLVWDERKLDISKDKHGLDFASVTLDFFVTALVRVTRDDRRQALGYIAGQPVSLVYKPLEAEALALISLRPASAGERALL